MKTADSAFRHTVLDTGLAFLQKPSHRHGNRFPRCRDSWRRRDGGYQKDGAKGY